MASRTATQRVAGEISRTYTVEASPDLSNWTLIAAPLNSDGILHFADPARDTVAATIESLWNHKRRGCRASDDVAATILAAREGGIRALL